MGLKVNYDKSMVMKYEGEKLMVCEISVDVTGVY